MQQQSQDHLLPSDLMGDLRPLEQSPPEQQQQQQQVQQLPQPPPVATNAPVVMAGMPAGMNTFTVQQPAQPLSLETIAQLIQAQQQQQMPQAAHLATATPTVYAYQQPPPQQPGAVMQEAPPLCQGQLVQPSPSGPASSIVPAPESSSGSEVQTQQPQQQQQPAPQPQQQQVIVVQQPGLAPLMQQPGQVPSPGQQQQQQQQAFLQPQQVTATPVPLQQLLAQPMSGPAVVPAPESSAEGFVTSTKTTGSEVQTQQPQQQQQQPAPQPQQQQPAPQPQQQQPAPQPQQQQVIVVQQPGLAPLMQQPGQVPAPGQQQQQERQAFLQPQQVTATPVPLQQLLAQPQGAKQQQPPPSMIQQLAQKTPQTQQALQALQAQQLQAQSLPPLPTMNAQPLPHPQGRVAPAQQLLPPQGGAPTQPTPDQALQQALLSSQLATKQQTPQQQQQAQQLATALAALQAQQQTAQHPAPPPHNQKDPPPFDLAPKPLAGFGRPQFGAADNKHTTGTPQHPASSGPKVASTAPPPPVAGPMPIAPRVAQTQNNTLSTKIAGDNIIALPSPIFLHPTLDELTSSVHPLGEERSEGDSEAGVTRKLQHGAGLSGKVSFHSFEGCGNSFPDSFESPTPQEQMTKLFLGQLPTYLSQKELCWMAYTFGGGAQLCYLDVITKVSTKGKAKVSTGCYHACVAPLEAHVLMKLFEDSVLVDEVGVWVAQSEAQKVALNEYCAVLKARKEQAAMQATTANQAIIAAGGSPLLTLGPRIHSTVVIQFATSAFDPSRARHVVGTHGRKLSKEEKVQYAEDIHTKEEAKVTAAVASAHGVVNNSPAGHQAGTGLQATAMPFLPKSSQVLAPSYAPGRAPPPPYVNLPQKY